MKENQLERKIQCPRCNEEVPKSSMNSHMDQKHGVKNFNQILKRSFQPEPDTSGNFAKKMAKVEVDSADLDALILDLNNNKIKTKQMI